ncbi:tumor necrosis factor receptor superfamily member 10A-like [Varanus komodoensis]|uniref:Uncharacterized protein n=2 Tax=Varanus komodoensis TaxID=61221 RepID=A0A8D2KWR2_VARKO|nr:tumor necrosis factor receptor superfamily member 10A-like [Varanus komodoensis]
MALGLWLQLLALLALLKEVELPALKIRCTTGEYPYSGQCCKNCPAGTYVAEHCIFPSTLGTCRRCTEGEDYTEHENGLEQCLPCKPCNFGFVEVRHCTVKNNTECQCKSGYYCPPGCEECIRCTKKCPEGQVVVRSCSATTDTECGSPPTETTNATLWAILVSVVILLLVLGIVLTLCICCRKDKASDCLINVPNPESTSSSVETSALINKFFENSERSSLESVGTNKEHVPGNEPSAPPLQPPDNSAGRIGQTNVPKPDEPDRVIVKDPSSEKLKELYYDSRNKVPPQCWKMLMRKSGLLDNDIEKIICDNAHHTDEQHYQMLKALQDRYGTGDALCKFLVGLRHMKLNHIYENLINELKSNDIITVETKD